MYFYSLALVIIIVSINRQWDPWDDPFGWCNYAKYWYACYTTYTYVFTQALIASPLLCPLVLTHDGTLPDIYLKFTVEAVSKVHNLEL